MNNDQRKLGYVAAYFAVWTALALVFVSLSSATALGGGNLGVIDTATDEVIARVKTSEATGRLRLTSDGQRAVVALSKKLVIFDVRTRRPVRETELGASPKVMTLSGDDRRAFLTNPDDNSVSVVDIVAGKQLTAFQTGRKPDGIGWVD